MKMLASIVIMLVLPLCITIILDMAMGFSLAQALSNPAHSFAVMDASEKVLLFILFMVAIIYKGINVIRRR